MWRDIPSRQWLVVGFLLSAVVPVMIVALIAYGAGQDTLRKQALGQLELARNIKRAQVERFFSERVSDAQVFAADPYLGTAATQLCNAYFLAESADKGALAGHDAGHFEAPAAYRQVHDRHHGFLRLFAEQNGFYDLLLVDLRRQQVCYSVKKEADFAASIASQPLLAEVVRAAALGSAVLSDTRPYPPSANAAAQFVAAPIWNGDVIIAVLVLQVSIEALDAIMGERSGMGATGETVLVGPDFNMRSDAQLDVARRVEASFRGTVSDNGIATTPVYRALAGEVGLGFASDHHGRPCLAAWSPVELLGTRWALVATIEAWEIDAQIAAALNGKIATALVLSLMVGLLLAFGVSWVTARGIASIRQQVVALAANVHRGVFAARGNPADVGVDFRGVLDEVNGLVAAMEKVTNEKTRLEALMAGVQRLEALGTLAGGIAHDFNNNLSYMHACVDIVRGLTPAEGPTAPHLEQLVTAIGRASDLVNRVLTFSRQGRHTPRPLNFVEPVNEAVELVRAAMPKRIALVVDLGDVRLPVLADPTAVHQAVLNLMTNAIYAMRGITGALEVCVTGRDVRAPLPHPALKACEYAVLRVCDQGTGMEAATLGHLFEPYFTTKPVGEGTGMGLALVHGIVAAAGGAITVESHLGVGTCFEVYWPLIADESAATTHS